MILPVIIFFFLFSACCIFLSAVTGGIPVFLRKPVDDQVLEFQVPEQEPLENGERKLIPC